jgi:membrane protein
VSSAYGAAGSLVVLLLWVYYSAMILFFGAEFTQVYARYRGKNVQPSRGAVRLTEEQRAHQGIPHRQSPAGTGPVTPTGASGQAGKEQGHPAPRPSGTPARTHVFAARSASD